MRNMAEQGVFVARERLAAALGRARAGAAAWRARSSQAAPGEGWSLAVPDISLACEVLLADRLFHDLRREEAAGLAGWGRASQQPSGAWHVPGGSLRT